MNHVRIRARRPMPIVLAIACCLGAALTGCAGSGAAAPPPAHASNPGAHAPLPPPGGPDFLFAPQDG
jgi:hypothetical protein